jgi:predicted nucleic acid-binding protein
MDRNNSVRKTDRPKIYMETTMFNFYFDEEEGEPHEYTVRLFEMIRDGVFEACTSYFVMDELSNAQEEKREKMIGLIDKYGIKMLSGNDEIRRIGDLYVEKGIIPKKYLTDALHIALASVYGLDIVVSMNFEHIVKPKTVRMTGLINIENGYNVIRICSPKEAVRYGVKN